MSADNDQYHSLMKQLSEETGQDLMPDEHGVLTLDDGDIRISIESQPAEPSIYFYSAIKAVDISCGSDLAEALQHNLFGQDVPGSWIALDRETNQLLLCYAAQKATATPDSLMSIVVSLADTVWKLRADKAPHDALPDAALDIAGGHDFSVIRA